MGVYFYLCRPDTKTMFEAGKSAWILLDSGDDETPSGSASVPRTVEGWLKRVKRYWTPERDEPEDTAYQQLMAEALQKFSVGGERFWVVDDAGDGVWEIATYLGFELTGSIYYLGTEKYEPELKRWNATHARYREDPKEIAYYKMSWEAMQALGHPKEVRLEET
jgi:hypothetical protein